MAIKSQPLHARVADEMRRAVADGTWPPGSKIPTEPNLCTEYDVSRVTVRHAVSALRAEGLLEIRQGDGTYVRVPHDPRQRTTLERAVTHSSGGYTTASSGQWDAAERPSVEHVQAEPAAAALLDITPKEAAMLVERLLIGPAGTRLRQTILIPMRYAIDTPLAVPSGGHFTTAANAYAALASRHGKIEWLDVTSARMPTPDETQVLHVPAAHPLLITQRITRTQDAGRPLMLETFAMAADAVQVSHIVRPTRPAPRS